jgi:hypothetical protein
MTRGAAAGDPPLAVQQRVRVPPAAEPVTPCLACCSCQADSQLLHPHTQLQPRHATPTRPKRTAPAAFSSCCFFGGMAAAAAGVLGVISGGARRALGSGRGHQGGAVSLCFDLRRPQGDSSPT